jgi:hypothetical protein
LNWSMVQIKPAATLKAPAMISNEGTACHGMLYQQSIQRQVSPVAAAVWLPKNSSTGTFLSMLLVCLIACNLSARGTYGRLKLREHSGFILRPVVNTATSHTNEVLFGYVRSALVLTDCRLYRKELFNNERG